MSELETSEIICANPDCRIADTGKCVEGMERDKCPHYGHAPAERNEVPEADSGIPLSAGGTLTPVETARLLRAGEARVISVIGPSDAGKTSLIAGLYDLFQNGPVADLAFAGSLSLHEFEHVCHDARAASRRDTPHISRTPRGEVRFYHLDLVSPTYGRLSLALGDRAGEEYRGAIDDISVVADFIEIPRADTLTLLVDGERLLDVGARHNLRSEIDLILQALIEAGAVATRPRLAIVLTKLDVVQASADRARTEADFAALVANIFNTFSGSFSQIQAFRVAASPKDDSVQRGTGVPELLTFWLESPPVPPTAAPSAQGASRIFGRLKEREDAEATI